MYRTLATATHASPPPVKGRPCSYCVLVTLSGHVVLHKQGQATMQGSLLTVNMVTGIANLGGEQVAGTANQAAAPGAPSGRVTGVITPKSSTGTP